MWPFVVLFLMVVAPASVDERLEPAFSALGSVPSGERYVGLVTSLRVQVAVEDLGAGVAGSYDRATRTVTIAEQVVGEDPRVVASLLAHEIQHASDLDLVAVGLLSAGCVELEVRGYEAQAVIGRALYPDELPGETLAERQLAGVVWLYEQDRAGIAARVAEDLVHQQTCGTGGQTNI